MNVLAEKTPKHGLLKARCEEDLEQFYTNLAALRRLDTSDIVRAALWEYRQRVERQLIQPDSPNG